MAIDRRKFLAGTTAAAALAVSTHARAPRRKPRVTFISQWSAGSDGAAISGLGKRLEEEGGIWQHRPVPGFTTEMMNKLRADIIAGNPPAASQLKGPEIAAWSKIAPTVNLDSIVAAAGYEKLIPAELVGLHKPQGHWIALPIQVYRIHHVPVAARDGEGRRQQTARDLGRVQQARREDETAGITHRSRTRDPWDDGMS
jgi:glucose/mannose transport system substrate-binding protein